MQCTMHLNGVNQEDKNRGGGGYEFDSVLAGLSTTKFLTHTHCKPSL